MSFPSIRNGKGETWAPIYNPVPRPVRISFRNDDYHSALQKEPLWARATESVHHEEKNVKDETPDATSLEPVRIH